MSVTNIDDTSYFNVNGIHERTSWDRNRYRGYMTYLAWQLDWPSSEDTTVGTPWHDNGNTGQLTTGMMDFDHYPSKGVTLYAMAATLNWAASGENSSDWLHYYYTLYWISQNNNHSDLHSDVVWDIAYNNIPVVAEVDASYLPNWDPSGGNIHHFITIVGYNDTAGVYYYMDSCGKTTACNGWSNNSDDDPGTGYPYQVSQGAMWNAVTSITENQGTGITAGDGGWVA
jgi:hypothetical protein